MIKTILLLSLFLASLFPAACSSIRADKLPPNIEPEVNSQTDDGAKPQESAIQLSSGGKVDFEGVSFNYNPQIFELRSESIVQESPMQDETEKPGENFPNHIAFSLYAKNKLIAVEATIKILPIADYRRMYAVSKDLTETFDENIDNLRKVLKNRNFRYKNNSGKDEIPFIPFYDAEQAFLAKVNHLPFQNGKGIAFITQYTMETTMINNEELSYFYEGITDNGKYYILAGFSVSVSFLLDSSDGEFEGYKLCCPYNKESIKGYERYISKVAKKLENLPADKYEPNLKYVNEIMSSLKVER